MLSDSQRVSLLAELRACRDLQQAKHLHACLSKCGESTNVYVANSLISMYARCGSLEDAQCVFHGMRERTVVSWNALMLGYAENGEALQALKLFKNMGCHPDALSFVAALKACAFLAQNEVANEKRLKVASLDKGRAIHSQAARSCWDSHLSVGTTLVNMYAKCGSMTHAQDVFDKMSRHSVVTWNALLLGYAENEQGEVALSLFSRMRDPDARSFVAAFKACSSLASKGSQMLHNGLVLHTQAACQGCESDVFVGSALVTMYAKFRCMIDAKKTFDRTRDKNVVCWTALMLGYVENREADVVLRLFASMKREGVSPDAQALTVALKACGMLAALDFGRALHTDTCTLGFQNEPVVANSFVDFYCKCGSMIEAQIVFDSMVIKDVVSWSSLMAGYSQAGDANQVLRLFEQMTDEGLKPDAIVFLCVLSACGHSGLVERGQALFELMETKYGISPGIEHYGCMISMLTRAGRLDDTMKMVQNMPMRPDELTKTMILSTKL